MIDFPTISEVAPKFAWILSGTLYFGVLLLYSKWAFTPPNSDTRYSRKTSLAILVFLYCLLALYCGDWSHLQTAVRESVGVVYQEGKGLERVYFYLANLLNGNYLLFRSLLWGTGVLFLLRCFKLSKLDPYRALFFLFGIYITTFAYTRAGVALSIFYTGFALLFQDKDDRNLFKIICGVGLIFVSTFFHRSVLVLVVLSPLALVPIKRRFIIPLSIIFAVVLSLFWNTMFSGALDYLLNSDEYAYRISLYEDLAGSTSFGFNLNGFFFLWYKGIIHIPFWFCVINLYKRINNSSVPLSIRAIFRFSLMLYAFTLVMLFVYGSASAFYYRFEGMLYIPITIMASYLFQYRVIDPSRYRLLFWICALSQGKDFLYRIFFL